MLFSAVSGKGPNKKEPARSTARAVRRKSRALLDILTIEARTRLDTRIVEAYLSTSVQSLQAFLDIALDLFWNHPVEARKGERKGDGRTRELGTRNGELEFGRRAKGSGERSGTVRL